MMRFKIYEIFLLMFTRLLVPIDCQNESYSVQLTSGFSYMSISTMEFDVSALIISSSKGFAEASIDVLTSKSQSSTSSVNAPTDSSQSLFLPDFSSTSMENYMTPVMTKSASTSVVVSSQSEQSLHGSYASSSSTDPQLESTMVQNVGPTVSSMPLSTRYTVKEDSSLSSVSTYSSYSDSTKKMSTNVVSTHTIATVTYSISTAAPRATSSIQPSTKTSNTFISLDSSFFVTTPALYPQASLSGPEFNPSATDKVVSSTFNANVISDFTGLSSSASASPVATSSPLIGDEFLIFRLTSILRNETFTAVLANHTTNSYTNLVALVENELHTILNETAYYRKVQVLSLTNFSSSVQVVADIYYNFTDTVATGILKNRIEGNSSIFDKLSMKELCTVVSCSNGGTCREAPNNITCSCKTGFSGPRCLSTYPVDGNYTSWSDYQSCSKSCGEGIQLRTRACTNPSPMHGGKNCSLLGIASEARACNTHGCDKDWVIWIIVGAAAFIFLMVVILACCFRRKKKYYYKDYGLTQDGKKYSLTRAAYVNKAYDENLSEFRSHDNVVPLEVLKNDPFKSSYANQQFEGEDNNRNSATVYERELKSFLGNTHNLRAKEQPESGEYLEPEHTFRSPKQPKEVGTTTVVYENTPERML